MSKADKTLREEIKADNELKMTIKALSDIEHHMQEMKGLIKFFEREKERLQHNKRVLEDSVTTPKEKK